MVIHSNILQSNEIMSTFYCFSGLILKTCFQMKIKINPVSIVNDSKIWGEFQGGKRNDPL